MKCLSIEKVYLYIEKELSEAENKKIEEHLTTCPKCQRALEERNLLLQAAESLPLWQPPPDFTQQVMAKIFPTKVPISSWIKAISAGFTSIILALFIFLLASGQNLSGLLISFNQILWNLIKNFALLFVKIFKLSTLLIKVIQQFFGFLINGFTSLTAIISPQVQIIIIAISIIVILTLIFGIKRKLFIGERT